MSRKKCRRRHYELINPITHAIMGAAVTDTAALDKLRLRELSALESFRTGTAGRHDWMALADMLNIQETLARGGIGPEALQPCLLAQEALTAAADRLASHGKFGVTGPQLQALREAYEYFDLQRSSIPRSRLEAAIRTTAARIRSADPSVKVCIDEATP